MEEVQKLRFARFMGFICLTIGMFSLLLGVFFQEGLLHLFPILLVLVVRPIFALTKKFPLGRMVYEYPYQWSEKYYTGGSITSNVGFNINGWIIAIIGGFILIVIGINLLQRKRYYLAYALFFIGSILEGIVSFFEGGSYDLSVVFMIFINIPIGIYFLKLWEKDKKESYKKNRQNVPVFYRR